MIGSRRDRLVAACDAGDHKAIHLEGWAEAWQLLDEIAAPLQRCSIRELAPYVRLLGDEDPADVVEAISATAGKFRPTVGELREHLNKRGGHDKRARRPGRGPDRTTTAEAFAAVARAVCDGEGLCDCGTSPMARKWRIDSHGILRCPDCRGLEQGQVFEAEDASENEAA